ncbi:uncharacterized protein LOC135483077 [Lineus longissimus]|uniref:uncharacterized protein LOC135483077 n=1 Tax=Lineus longissimus TaxID=88925 RepID=UPI002B4EB204
MAVSMATYGDVKEVILKAPDDREAPEVEKLLPWFRHKSDLLRNLKRSILIDLVKKCKFIKKHENDIIIKQGEIGACFYIILKGKVTIYKQNNEDDLTWQQLLENNAVDIGDRHKLGQLICTLGPGECFGEVALISKESLRTSSIISDKETHLILVDKELYTSSIQNILSLEFTEKTDFVSNNPLFSNWPHEHRKKLAIALNKDEMDFEDILVKQGDLVEEVYFIIEGEVKLVIDPTMHPKQYPSYKLSTKVPSTNGKSKPIRQNSAQQVEYALYGQDELLGSTEVLLGMDTYFYTATCTRNTSVFALSRGVFLRMIAENHHHHQTRETLLSRSEISMTKLLTGTKEKQVPILKKMLEKVRGNNNPNKIRAKLQGSLKKKKKETGALGKFMLSLKFGGTSSSDDKDTVDSTVPEAPSSDIDSYRGSIANVELSPDEYFLFKQTLSGVGLYMDRTEEEEIGDELAEEEEDTAEEESLEDRIRKFLNTGSGTADSPGRVAKMRAPGEQHEKRRSICINVTPKGGLLGRR